MVLDVSYGVIYIMDVGLDGWWMVDGGWWIVDSG